MKYILFLIVQNTKIPERHFPDSMPPSDRRWLLVARSADFADVGPTLGQWLTANHNSGYISLHFADVGPTLGQRWIFIQDGGEQ